MHRRNHWASRTAVTALSVLVLATTTASAHEFLQGAGGARTAPDIYVTDELEELGEDDGGVRTAPDIYVTNEREEFLEDGGSISRKPNFDVLTVRGRSRGWRPAEQRRVVRHRRGSFITLTSGRVDRHSLRARAPSWQSRYGFGAVPTGPRIIDVERERLDRQPIPASGIAIIETGGSKIIRINPGYNRHAAARSGSAPARRASPGEPWTPEWLSFCTRAYASFDPNFGTYIDAAGNSRFCTGN